MASKDTVEAVRVLARTCTDKVIAGALNRSGLRTGRGNRWTRERVTSLRTWNKIPRYCAERRQSEGWLNLTEAANLLGISSRTLRLAVERGDIEAEHPLGMGPWVLKKAALETEAAIHLVDRVRRRNGTPTVPTAGQETFDFSSA